MVIPCYTIPIPTILCYICTQLQPKLHGPHIAKNGWSSCKAIWRGSLGKLCFGKGR